MWRKMVTIEAKSLRRDPILRGAVKRVNQRDRRDHDTRHHRTRTRSREPRTANTTAARPAPRREHSNSAATRPALRLIIEATMQL